MLGTWRTNDAEKNHIHKIGKRKKKKEKRKKEKRHSMMDGMELENGMGFLCGKEQEQEQEGETHEGRKELRYDTSGRRRSRSGTSEHNQPYLTLPYLSFYMCIFYRLSAGYVPVVVRDFTCYILYLLLQVQGGRWVCTMLLRHKSPSSPGMTVGDYRSSALYIWSSTAPGGGFVFLF